LVLSVFPGVEDSFVWGADAVLFKELEVGPEQVDEVFKEEFLVNVPPDVLGKLLHETLVFVGLYGIVLVVLPVVFEVLLELLG
jgi:hypothetical protein